MIENFLWWVAEKSLAMVFVCLSVCLPVCLFKHFRHWSLKGWANRDWVGAVRRARKEDGANRGVIGDTATFQSLQKKKQSDKAVDQTNGQIRPKLYGPIATILPDFEGGDSGAPFTRATVTCHVIT